MATRNIVPRATGEGQIGTSAKTWDAGYFDDLAVTNGVTASTFTGDLTGDVTGNVTGDVTGTASGNLATTGGTMTGAVTFNTNSTVNIKNDGDASATIITGGNSDIFDGASLQLFGRENSTYPGRFYLRASNKTGQSDSDASHNNVDLVGRPDGTLQWDGKDVERVHASGTGYIQYTSGLQICWGATSTITSATTVTCNFGAAFKDTNYRVAIGRYWVSATAEQYYIQDFATTGFKLTTIGTVGGGGHSYQYIAVGLWK